MACRQDAALTDCAASTLDAAVTAEMTMSAPRTASAAELRDRTPMLSPACRSFSPSRLRKQDVPGRHVAHAGLAQSGGDGLAGFAEADEAQLSGFAHLRIRSIIPCGIFAAATDDGRFSAAGLQPRGPHYGLRGVIGASKNHSTGGIGHARCRSIKPRAAAGFIKFLAASPLFAGDRLSAFGRGAVPANCRPIPMVWAPRDYDHLIRSPKEALDVFDFEPVMHKNVPPAHFGYMASGVDDDVTLRANRAGFQKFQLRPRRLVDVSKVDMSTEILGAEIQTPIIIDPTGGHKAYHPDGEEGVARAAKIGDHLMILSTQATTSVADVIAARGKPIWSQLYATNKFEVAKHHVESMERQGSIAVAVTVDRNGGRNQEVALRMRKTRHARNARPATTTQQPRGVACGTSRCTRAPISPG